MHDDSLTCIHVRNMQFEPGKKEELPADVSEDRKAVIQAVIVRVMKARYVCICAYVHMYVCIYVCMCR